LAWGKQRRGGAVAVSQDAGELGAWVVSRGGVAPLRPYDRVGRDFGCFAALGMTAPFLSPACGELEGGFPRMRGN